MPRKAILTLLTAPLLGISLNCTPPSTQNSYERNSPTYQENVVKDKRVETDAYLADKMKVLKVTQTTVQEDMLKIQVQILNDDTWDGDVDYKFEWMDDTGMTVDSPVSSWNTAHFGPKEMKSLQSVAPSPKCKDFRLKLQQNQKN